MTVEWWLGHSSILGLCGIYKNKEVSQASVAMVVSEMTDFYLKLRRKTFNNRSNVSRKTINNFKHLYLSFGFYLFRRNF